MWRPSPDAAPWFLSQQHQTWQVAVGGETHGCNFPIWDREKRWKKAPMLWMSELSFGMSPAGMSPKCRWQRLNRVLQCVWRGSMALVCLVQKSIQNSLAKESQISGWVKLIRLPKSPKWMLQCKTDQFCGSHWYTVYTYFFSSTARCFFCCPVSDVPAKSATFGLKVADARVKSTRQPQKRWITFGSYRRPPAEPLEPLRNLWFWLVPQCRVFQLETTWFGSLIAMITHHHCRIQQSTKSCNLWVTNYRLSWDVSTVALVRLQSTSVVLGRTTLALHF